MTTLRRDKQALLASAGSYNGGCVRDVVTLSTADATATVVYSIPVAVGQAVGFRALIVGQKDDATSGLVSTVVAGARRQSAGNVTSLGSASIVTIEDNAAAPVATVNANTSAQTFELKLAGVAAETWHWEVQIEYIKTA